MQHSSISLKKKWNSLLRLNGVALRTLMQIKKSMSANYMVSTVYARWKICFGTHSEFLIPLQKYLWIHSFLLSKVHYFDLHICRVIERSVTKVHLCAILSIEHLHKNQCCSHLLLPDTSYKTVSIYKKIYASITTITECKSKKLEMFNKNVLISQ